MESKTPLRQAHLEHQLWLNEVDFYREELAIFDRHLSGIDPAEYPQEISGKADRFREEFARQRDRINQLEHDIRLAETRIAQYLKEHPAADLDAVLVGDQHEIRTKIFSFKEDYQKLKEEFIQFETAQLNE